MRIFVLFAFSLFFLLSCAENANIPEQGSERIIRFSGYNWIVYSSKSEKRGPGPNYFSDSESNVWVDALGQLHLKIAYRNGHWYCSKVVMQKSYGFNKYIFYVASRVDQFDKNVVGGLFTYKNDNEEIDIEFSKWGKDMNEDCQFAVQPTSRAGNKIRYRLQLDEIKSTHSFSWQKNKIDFISYRGHDQYPSASKIIQKWTYTGIDIPPDSDERLEINLWLFRGIPPSNNDEAEMIIERIEIQ